MKFKKIHPWFRARGYLHFDHPVKFETAQKVVTSPKRVASHAFFPLISYAVESTKISKDKKTKQVTVKYKERPIAYSSHMDSHIYSYYALQLANLYEIKLKENNLSNSILAFRSLGKSNIDFAHDAFQKIKSTGECSAIALDFSKFFDKLDHQILKSKWCELLSKDSLSNDHFNVFKSLTKFSTVNKVKLYNEFSISPNNPKNGRNKVCDTTDFRNIVRKNKLIETNKNAYGIPQGSPISALLSNIYMLDFDTEMKRYVDIHRGEYYRYCDDMLFIVPAGLRDKVAGFAQQKIKELKVTINPSKTELRTFSYKGDQLISDMPLQYLGFIFDGENVFIRSSSIARYSEKMKKGVRLAKKTMVKYNAIRSDKGLPEQSLYKKKLYGQYSHLGGRNFITYGLRAAKTMDSRTIKRQLKPFWNRLHDEIEKT